MKRTVGWALQHRDVYGAGAAKRRQLGSAEDVKKAVFEEFKRGTLRAGGSKKHVKDRKVALAIALSEASKKK